MGWATVLPSQHPGKQHGIGHFWLKSHFSFLICWDARSPSAAARSRVWQAIRFLTARLPLAGGHRNTLPDLPRIRAGWRWPFNFIYSLLTVKAEEQLVQG